MTDAEIRRRGRLLFVVLTVLGLRWPSHAPELVQALRGWLGSWAGIGHVAGGMARQGYDIQLTRHGEVGGGPRSTNRGRSTPSSPGRPGSGRPGRPFRWRLGGRFTSAGR